MNIWILVLLIASAWLTYPIVGAATVQLAVLEGKRPKGAGFSFLPELIIYPITFFGMAALIDWFVMPYGRIIVASICVIMLIYGTFRFLRCIMKIRYLEKKAGHDTRQNQSLE